MNTWEGHFWPQVFNLNKLGRGSLGDASHQISNIKYQSSRPCGFRQEDFFHVSPYINLCKQGVLRSGHFWPQGHNLNKLGRGPHTILQTGMK